MPIVLLLLLFLTGCRDSEHSLKVAATPVPHAVMLEEVARPILAKEGIDLEIIVLEDYHLPNKALQAREVDANFFQHELYLKQQESLFGYKFRVLAPVHIEPMGLYSAKCHDLRSIKTIAIPADPSNKARALALMEKAGLHPEEILEVEGILLARSYEEVDAAIIPTNYALQIGLTPDRDALVREDSNSPYVNILVIREGEENDPRLQALKKAMTGPEMEEFIKTYYQGALEL